MAYPTCSGHSARCPVILAADGAKGALRRIAAAPCNCGHDEQCPLGGEANA